MSNFAQLKDNNARRKLFNPQAPVAQKVSDVGFVDVSKVKKSSFFNRTSLTPHQIFDAHLLENINFSNSSFHFSVGFYITIMF